MVNKRRIKQVVIALVCFIGSAVPVFANSPSFSGKVVGISDGDTITVLHDGRGEKVRLYGIDCPEKGQDFGNRAKQYASAEAFGKVVRVNSKDRDRYGRTVGDVMLPDGASLSHKMVRSGLAWWYRKYAPRDKELQRLEQVAKRAGIGIWSRPDPVPPWEYRGNVTSSTDLAQPGQPVKMSKSSICHAPGTMYYGRTKSFKPFDSVKECLAAGGRLPKK